MCEKIAIIGITSVFPGAKNSLEFWENLRLGKDSISRRYSPDGSKIIYAKGEINLEEVHDIINEDYSEDELVYMAPQLKGMILVADRLKALLIDDENKVGVFSAVNSTFNWKMNILEKYGKETILQKEHLIDEQYFSTRISYSMNWQGPSVVLSSACSSALVALKAACSSIKNGECNKAIVIAACVDWGVESIELSKISKLYSPDGYCRTFDEACSGTVLSDGIGAVILEPLQTAISNKHDILAVIRAIAANNDGKNKLGYEVPSVSGIGEVFGNALEYAKIKPEELAFIDIHGSGTPLGDLIELEALKSIFGEKDTYRKCLIGSVQPNIGFLAEASGMASLIKSILKIRNRTCSPNIHVQKLTNLFDFRNSPFFVNKENVRIESDKVYAGVNTYGDGGTNVHVILENA